MSVKFPPAPHLNVFEPPLPTASLGHPTVQDSPYLRNPPKLQVRPTALEPRREGRLHRGSHWSVGVLVMVALSPHTYCVPAELSRGSYPKLGGKLNRIVFRRYNEAGKRD